MMIKTLHVSCAYLAGLGFLLRGIGILIKHPAMHHKIVKVIPHIIDTILLISGIILAIHLSLSPHEQPWLAAKLITLFLYIGFGLLLIRWGTTQTRQWTGLLGGLMAYLYIVGAAHSKSVYSIFTAFF